MLGNRGGKFHRDDRTLGKRRWASQRWICCELHYKDWHHEPMGQGYTSLFFVDEVTALAAGHRPCFLCRREEAKRFVLLSGLGTCALDNRLHAERSLQFGGGLFHSAEPPDPHPGPPHKGEGVSTFLPDGTMVECGGDIFAVRGEYMLRWSFGGYVDCKPLAVDMKANLLTPPAIIAILAQGYQPRWHPSALQWETS